MTYDSLFTLSVVVAVVVFVDQAFSPLIANLQACAAFSRCFSINGLGSSVIVVVVVIIFVVNYNIFKFFKFFLILLFDVIVVDNVDVFFNKWVRIVCCCCCCVVAILIIKIVQ